MKCVERDEHVAGDANARAIFHIQFIHYFKNESANSSSSLIHRTTSPAACYRTQTSPRTTPSKQFIPPSTRIIITIFSHLFARVALYSVCRRDVVASTVEFAQYNMYHSTNPLYVVFPLYVFFRNETLLFGHAPQPLHRQYHPHI